MQISKTNLLCEKSGFSHGRLQHPERRSERELRKVHVRTDGRTGVRRRVGSPEGMWQVRPGLDTTIVGLLGFRQHGGSQNGGTNGKESKAAKGGVSTTTVYSSHSRPAQLQFQLSVFRRGRVLVGNATIQAPHQTVEGEGGGEGKRASGRVRGESAKSTQTAPQRQQASQRLQKEAVLGNIGNGVGDPVLFHVPTTSPLGFIVVRHPPLPPPAPNHSSPSHLSAVLQLEDDGAHVGCVPLPVAAGHENLRHSSTMQQQDHRHVAHARRCLEVPTKLVMVAALLRKRSYTCLAPLRASAGATKRHIALQKQHTKKLRLQGKNRLNKKTNNPY